MCFPSKETVTKQVKLAVKEYRAKSVFVASDHDYLIPELTRALKRMEVREALLSFQHLRHVIVYSFSRKKKSWWFVLLGQCTPASERWTSRRFGHSGASESLHWQLCFFIHFICQEGAGRVRATVIVLGIPCRPSGKEQNAGGIVDNCNFLVLTLHGRSLSTLMLQFGAIGGRLWSAPLKPSLQSEPCAPSQPIEFQRCRIRCRCHHLDYRTRVDFYVLFASVRRIASNTYDLGIRFPVVVACRYRINDALWQPNSSICLIWVQLEDKMDKVYEFFFIYCSKL